MVCLKKDGRPVVVTAWVIEVYDEFVHFRMGELSTEFIALRTGPDSQQITDDTGVPMHIYKYLGKV